MLTLFCRFMGFMGFAVLPVCWYSMDVQRTLAFRSYAFVEVVPSDGDTASLYDSLQAYLARSEKRDSESEMKFGTDRPPVMYVDEAGAKTYLSRMLRASYENLPNSVQLSVGFAAESVERERVTEKRDRVIHLVEEECKAAQKTCAVSYWFAGEQQRQTLSAP